MHGSSLLRLLLILILFLINSQLVAQEELSPSTKEFRGTASLTNNGISLIPSFSLGDPALLFDLKFIKNRFSIEPDLRFALEGKPWLFLVWFRYKALNKGRFNLRVGAHPALNFRTISIVRNGQVPEAILESRRYLAAELAPGYKLSDKVSLGMYYLHGRGFDEGVKQTHFLTLNMSVNHFYLSEQTYLNFTPQVYYLQTDALKGYYLNGTMSVIRNDFPLFFSLLVNQALKTEIAPEKDLLWSVSLNYRF